ncbi:MAG TPA: hypothetical protein DCE42_18410 [Myxococcales bacterium]|nr:hypothetical protein [Myxococcales bacterium]
MHFQHHLPSKLKNEHLPRKEPLKKGCNDGSICVTTDGETMPQNGPIRTWIRSSKRPERGRSTKKQTMRKSKVFVYM